MSEKKDEIVEQAKKIVEFGVAMTQDAKHCSISIDKTFVLLSKKQTFDLAVAMQHIAASMTE